MSWILALTLFSSPDGKYIREFSTEKECVQEFDKLVSKNKNNDNIKSIACINSDLLED